MHACHAGLSTRRFNLESSSVIPSGNISSDPFDHAPNHMVASRRPHQSYDGSGRNIKLHSQSMSECPDSIRSTRHFHSHYRYRATKSTFVSFFMGATRGIPQTCKLHPRVATGSRRGSGYARELVSFAPANSRKTHYMV